MYNTLNSNIKTEKNGHYYWLDLLRFLAAFAVMACHFRGAFFTEYSLLPETQHNPLVFSFYFITRLGFEAVLVFFVLSGFLVGGRAIKRIQDGTFRAKDYVIDRFARIMLPLIASLLFYLPICLYFKTPIIISDWIGSILSLQGIFTQSPFATLWSLSYEVWFYILIFSIALLLTARNNKSKSFIGLILLIASMLVFVKLKVSYLWVWFLGAIILTNNAQISEHYRKIVCIITFTISILFILILQISSETRFLSFNVFENIILLRDLIIVLFGVSFSLFIKSVIKLVPKSKFLISINLIGTKLAAFSYTLYLTHAPVLRLLEHLGAPKSDSVNILSISLYIAWLAIGLIIAYALYYNSSLKI